jgi:ankyrin repeat protein
MAENETVDLPLHSAKTAQEVSKLIAEGHDVNGADKLGNTPLHTVSSLEVAQALLKNGAKLEAESKNGNTPIFQHSDNAKITQYLIQKGAEINKSNRFGFTPLHFAETKEVAEILIDAGADIEAKNVREITPVMSATMANRNPVIKTLAEARANLNAQDKKSKNTALHEALENMNLQAIDILLTNGADMNIGNISRKGAYEVSKEKLEKSASFKKIVTLFEDFKSERREAIQELNLDSGKEKSAKKKIEDKKQTKKTISLSTILKKKSTQKIR